MKLTLEYDGMEEREEYMLALNAGKWCTLVEDITEWVRQKRKYMEQSAEEGAILDMIWKHIWELRREAGLDAE